MPKTLFRPTCSAAAWRQGFTMVEMSIVLLLIALLAGGIVAGVNLKRSAEIKSIPDEITALRGAVGTFRDRYSSLPGDMYNATKFWAEQNSTPSVCVTTRSSGPRTCNGDGNGLISTFGDGTTYYESQRFWQHLNNASLITGHYDGDRFTTNTYPTCRVLDHCGRSKYRNGLIYAATVGRNPTYFRSSTVVQDLYDGDKGNTFLLFGPPSSTAGTTSAVANVGASVGAPMIPASDLQQLDLKMDDGRPSSGFIQTFKPVASSSSYLFNNCSLSATTYNIGDNTAKCAALFTNAF